MAGAGSAVPSDTYPADDEFYFVFAEPVPRKTVIVTDDSTQMRPLELAAAISPIRTLTNTAEFISPDQLATVVWEEVSLLVWQSTLPQPDEAELVDSFVDSGGQVVFLPPENPDDTNYRGATWKAWQEPKDPIAIETWRGDHELVGTIPSRCGLAGRGNERLPLLRTGRRVHSAGVAERR